MHIRKRWTFLYALWLLSNSCVGSETEDKPMQLTQLLNAVTDENIEFLTTRHNHAAMPTLDRRVVVTGPPDVVKLLPIGDVRVLEELVTLLRDPNRAWAAEVVLAALTHNEEDIVNAFAAHPERWQDSVGKNAYDRWNKWLTSHERALSWDPQEQVFVERQGQ